LTSRRNDLTKTVKSMSIHDIKPIFKNAKGYGGGLEDIGNFKEGFCWKVIKSDDASWIMCSDNMKEKEEWMEAIMVIKGAATIFAKPDKTLEGSATIDMGSADGGLF